MSSGRNRHSSFGWVFRNSVLSTPPLMSFLLQVRRAYFGDFDKCRVLCLADTAIYRLPLCQPPGTLRLITRRRCLECL